MTFFDVGVGGANTKLNEGFTGVTGAVSDGLNNLSCRFAGEVVRSAPGRPPSEGREYIEDTPSEDTKQPEWKKGSTVENSSRTHPQGSDVGRDARERGAVVVASPPRAPRNGPPTVPTDSRSRIETKEEKDTVEEKKRGRTRRSKEGVRVRRQAAEHDIHCATDHWSAQNVANAKTTKTDAAVRRDLVRR